MGLIRAVGEALWGPRWQQEMAQATGVKARQVRRWNAGDTEVPAKYWQVLKNIARDRRAECGTAVALIKMHQEALAASNKNGEHYG